MIGYRFSEYVPSKEGSVFDQLLELFKEMLVYTSGDVSESLAWLTQVDKEYGITNEEYGMGDFIQDLIDKGLIQNPDPQNPGFVPSSKLEVALRRKALEDIFGQLKKTKHGNHSTTYGGKGDDYTADLKPYEFGDALDNLAISESIRNAQINHGIDEFQLTQKDLEVKETYYQSQTSTVLMIDISHSMILYGEDRITPAKKVAMALAELITTRYPKDTLDILVFGNDAWQIEIKDLPYLKVGPYHTNTIAGLELAMDLLRKRKNPNKQIFMITDGKPTCLKVGIKYYKNAFGIDSKILNETLKLAAQCRKLKIPVTTFMIASDPYLKEFVKEFTKVNNGNAYYSSLKGLGDLIFEDYKRNRTKKF